MGPIASDDEAVKSGGLKLANKRSNNDPALALLSEDIELAPKPSKQKNKIEVNNKNKDDDDALFDHVSSPSAKLLFGDDIDEKEQNDPFSSIEAEFNKLSYKMDDIQSDDTKKKRKKKEN